MKPITPEYINKYISFKYGNPDWLYDADGPNDIPKLQAEGSAKLWNLLLEKEVALLADEVGTGKTYQALAIMITLWLENPRAKILLYAPNEAVARQWEKEYSVFIRYHYKFTDDKIKSSIDGRPLPQAIYCENQLDLLRRVNEGWHSLFICKTSSLSNFNSKKITQNELDQLKLNIKKDIDERSGEAEKEKWMFDFAVKSHDFVKEKLGADGYPPFDLLVFDEAHYLRNSDGDTNKSLTAHAFFARRDKKNLNPQKEPLSFLSKSVLLLTATPNHSSSKNIQSIISIFSNHFIKATPKDILDQICVRRFRRLHSKTKHQYRRELEEPVEMRTIEEKLFFAMYQRSLVKYKAEEMKKNVENTRRQNPYRLLYGYLEGFEFLPNKRTGDGKIENNRDTTDFVEQDDKAIIQSLANTYNKIYKHYPDHPKYSKTVGNLSSDNTASLHPEKKLIFVRRIPSIYEITRRVIEEYDKQFAAILLAEKSLRLNRDFKNWAEKELRRHFARLKPTGEADPLSSDGSEVDAEDLESSKYYSLFTVKKTGKYRSTDCSNFRIRFSREDSLFSLFMKPDVSGQAGDTTPYKTLLTIWENKAEDNSSDEIKNALREYGNFSSAERQGFANYLSKGLLFASSYLFIFYACFKKVYKANKPEDSYRSFCEEVASKIDSSGLSELIAKAINTFRIFYKKRLNLTEDKLPDEKWAFLNNTPPVYPYCSDTRRESILTAFNTPFYPNVLVATSVLQEGVDLHYHCNTVIHYGLAWTQGDNEQRVGRVDRLNGKMENQLKKSPDASLDIHYPYLKRTIDEDQMARFISNKTNAENLIDNLISFEESKEIDYLARTNKDWKKGFNTPRQFEEGLRDPFPVVHENDFKNIFPAPRQWRNFNSSKAILDQLFDTLSRQFKDEFFTYGSDSRTTDNKIFEIKHVRENGRHQPVIAGFDYYKAGFHILGRLVYHLRITTPLYHRGYEYDNLTSFGRLKEVYARNPVIKIGFDKSCKRNNPFRYFACVDLPLFYTNEQQLNLSEAALIQVVTDLVAFADELEEKYTAGDHLNTHPDETLIPWIYRDSPLRANNLPLTIQPGWTAIGDYIYKEVVLESSISSLSDTFTLNRNHPFLKYYRNLNQDHCCIGCQKNASPEEITLFNHIFKNAPT